MHRDRMFILGGSHRALPHTTERQATSMLGTLAYEHGSRWIDAPRADNSKETHRSRGDWAEIEGVMNHRRTGSAARVTFNVTNSSLHNTGLIAGTMRESIVTV